jgi:hypothetical protein
MISHANLRKVILALILIAFLLPLGASAATLKGGETYSLKEGDTITDNLYVGAGEVSIVGDVTGDLVTGGGTVTISGNVASDIIAGGGSVSVLDNVGGDVRVAGGDILVTSAISGDLIILGGNVRILSDASVGGDLVVLGGRVLLEGNVTGEVTVVGGEIEMDSAVQGNVYTRGETIVIGDNTVISGSLTYSGKDEDAIEISESAVISGETIFKPSKAFDKEGIRIALLAFFGLFLLLKIVAFITIAILATILFRKFSTRVARGVISNPWKEVLRGFIVLIVTPAAIVLSFMTIVGAMVGILGILSYVTLMILTAIYAGVIFGAWVQKLLLKSDSVTVTWKNASLGIVGLTIVTMIPYVGWLIGFFFFLVSLGSISGIVYHSFWVGRK